MASSTSRSVVALRLAEAAISSRPPASRPIRPRRNPPRRPCPCASRRINQGSDCTSVAHLCRRISPRPDRGEGHRSRRLSNPGMIARRSATACTASTASPFCRKASCCSASSRAARREGRCSASSRQRSRRLAGGRGVRGEARAARGRASGLPCSEARRGASLTEDPLLAQLDDDIGVAGFRGGVGVASSDRWQRAGSRLRRP